MPPTFATIQNYPSKTIIASKFISVFPQANALQLPTGWQPILQTQANSWTETSDIKDQIQYNEILGEVAGPLTLGGIKEHEINEKNQRIAILGDGDFLSNRYIGNGGNIEIAIKIIQWLTPSEGKINRDNAPKANRQLTFTNQTLSILAISSLIVLPLIFLLTGFFIWLRRRHL